MLEMMNPITCKVGNGKRLVRSTSASDCEKQDQYTIDYTLKKYSCSPQLPKAGTKVKSVDEVRRREGLANVLGASSR